MDKKTFYGSIKDALFGGHLAQSQVDGIEALIDKGLNDTTDLRFMAYILGTTLHETARTMQPIEEYGRGAGRDYGRPDPVTGKTYYGRGFVQLTHKANYKTMGDAIGVDLVNHPELALDLKNATEIIYRGMINGMFTRHGLPEFFNNTTSDWYNARRIVNGLDQAARIAGYGVAFYKASLLAPGQPQPRDVSPDAALPEPNYVDMEKQAILALDF
jgi:hypothetical protein